MKIDFINLLVVICASALLAWGGYSMTETEGLKLLVAAVSFITLCVSGSCVIAVRFGEHRSSVVIRVTSGVFFVFLMFMNGVFTFFDFSKPLYIILNAIVLLVLLLVNRSVARSGM